MSSRTHRLGALRTAAILAAVTTAVAVVPGTAMGSEQGTDAVTPVVEGLDGPRGLDMRPRRAFYAETDGSVSRTIIKGDAAGDTKVIAQVPPSFVAPVVATAPGGRVYILAPGGEPGQGATLYVKERGQDEPRVLADIAAYQASDPDPYDLEENPGASNPYGLAALDDGALVADAEGNDLLRVSLDGDIETVARIKPRVVLMPEGIEGEDLPPPGTPIPAEGVATSVTVGADGYYYVGELRGFPATEGTSQVWRIKPNAEGAVCDPESPSTGDCKRFADGFTSIVDLGANPRSGQIFVVELVQESWLKWEQGTVDPIGGLFRIPAGGGDPVELAAGELVLPGAVDVLARAGAHVTTPIFGEGAVLRVER